jgi:hypothetical protein
MNRTRLFLTAALVALASSASEHPHHAVSKPTKTERTADDISARQAKRQRKLARRAARHKAGES